VNWLNFTQLQIPPLPSMVQHFLIATLLCLELIANHHALAQSESPSTSSFTDVTASLGLQPSSSQACWCDLNQDSWPDLCAGGVVWKNNGGKSFTKWAEGLGEVIAGDFDNDGRTDLFSYSTRKLYRNSTDEQFAIHPLPELPNTVSLGACWGDWNNDGLLDLFVAGYEDWDAGITYPSFFLNQKPNHEFQLGQVDARYRARGVTACDFDRDGDLDIYVSNYRLQPNVLWINDGTGNFTDSADKLNALGTSPGFAGGHSIGACWGDFDSDSQFDLFVGNFAHVDARGDQPKSRFLKNTNPSPFEDKGICGVFYQESYASPASADYDNDGDLDLFFTTVYESASFGLRNQPTLFQQQSPWEFKSVTKESMLDGLGATYQAAWADFDLDGDLDLATAGKIYRNDLAKDRHWITLRLNGDGKAINRSAIGAQARIHLKDRCITRQIEAGTGQGNQNDFQLHFGLGSHDQTVQIQIEWPNGKKSTNDNVAVDKTVSIDYPVSSID